MRKLKDFVLSHFEGSIIVLVLFGILAIAFLVHYKLSFLNFFFLPVILSGYFLGKKEAVLFSTFCVLGVTLYLIFGHLYLEPDGQAALTLDEMINLATWGGFLILTGALIGSLSEKRERELAKMRQAYVGVLAIMLKYFEMADEEKPRSLRVSLLAGTIAKRAGLSVREIENIKSVALLSKAGELQTSLPFFGEVAAVVSLEPKGKRPQLSDHERVMLSTTASLLKEIEPLLLAYFEHYVKEADTLDKNIEAIPPGASIVALAELVDGLQTQGSSRLGKVEVNSFKDIENLSGRAFPKSLIDVLRDVILTL